jgi:NAD+ diphosphatase
VHHGGGQATASLPHSYRADCTNPPSDRADSVPLIIASRPNVYSGNPLDRVGARREDAAWVTACLEDPDTLFVPVWRSQNLVAGLQEDRPEAVYLSGEAAATLRMADGPWALLGMMDGNAVFAVDVSSTDDPLPLLPPGNGQFADLRAIGWGVARPEAAILAHARGLMHWRARQRFCGVCGARCEPRSAGHMMRCTSCKTEHFPRTDPAVIMLVERGDRVLLGHSKRFPRANMYSALAGFVEPGETLEEAVRREVLEESGIEVGDVWYHSSQPWPFPSNIMLGFHAEGLNDDIVVDDEEMVDVRWFTREQIANPPTHGFVLPRLDSIARRLIEDWYASA